MQFSSKEDIDAPLEQVFAALSQFDTMERTALSRGIEVDRLHESETPQPGMAWLARFTMRSKPREVHIVLDAYDPPNMMLFTSGAQGLSGRMTLELMAMSARRTRMSVVLNLSPSTLSARLIIQSLKLAKTGLRKRFKLKVADFARGLEGRLQNAPDPR